MTKKYHFISGLPRSGSTLLSSILKQNPKFTAGISDPLEGYARAIISQTQIGVGLQTTVSVDKRKTIIQGLFDSFYLNDTEVCFNTNRGWTSSTSLLADIFPDFKMIVCLRDIPWILDSFEQLNAKNPYTIKALYHHQNELSVYERTHMLMGNISNMAGYVLSPINNVKQSMFSNERNHILYVEYDNLVKNPLSTMKQIYNFLGEEWWEHDFNDVEDSYDEFDEQAKIVGLHTIRKKVEYKERRSILPGDLWAQYNESTFWKLSQFQQIKNNLNWVQTSMETSKNNINRNTPKINKQL
jgi:sulfotransferase